MRQKRQTIGMIFQHFNLMAQKTAYENVAFALRHSKLSNEEKDKKIRDLLELVDLADRAENYPAIVRWSKTTCSDCACLS